MNILTTPKKRSKKLIFTAVGGLTGRHEWCLLCWFWRILLTGSQIWFPWQPQMMHDCIMFDSPNIISAPPWDLALVCLSSLCLWKACFSERLWKLILHLFLSKTCPFTQRDLHFQSSKCDWAPLQISLPGQVKFFPGVIKEKNKREFATKAKVIHHRPSGGGDWLEKKQQMNIDIV